MSIVLPAHNEEAVLEHVVTTCITTLDRLRADFEVIVVNDGSVDSTGAVADALAAADSRIRVVHTVTNVGYGAALRAGFAAASKSTVFFMDSDGQFDIAEIEQFLQLSAEGHAVVIGYRARREDALLRKLNAWAWNRLVRSTLRFKVRDIDCAFKLYDAHLLRALDVQSTGAMINAEMLAKLARMG
ncbi:MAG: glycosyltransferase family 2 protein, partial [Candidatus Dormibacteraeota bacterium]|nr:glycosyltransferase family 2 protein [Candidatus Dormibacteraeota bacterium]